jgi:hypothetical protein
LTKKRRTTKAEYVGDEETVRRVAGLIAAAAPELKPRADECPPDVFWIVVTTRDGRSLGFTAGDQFWEGDLFEHVHGTGRARFDGITTELPSTTTEPAALAAAIRESVGWSAASVGGRRAKARGPERSSGAGLVSNEA